MVAVLVNVRTDRHDPEVILRIVRGVHVEGRIHNPEYGCSFPVRGEITGRSGREYLVKLDPCTDSGIMDGLLCSICSKMVYKLKKTEVA